MTLTPIWELLVRRVGVISRQIHDMIWDDVSQSLCARAWWLKDKYVFWWIWTYVFTRRHCRRAFVFHVKRRRNLKYGHDGRTIDYLAGNGPERMG